MLPSQSSKSKVSIPFWAVTRYSDVSYVSSNSRLFRNGDRSTTLVPRLSDKTVRMIRDGAPHMLRTLIQMDDPDHRSYRAIMQGWFTPDRIKRSEPLIRGAAREILQKFERAGSFCDLVQMARLYTVTVFSVSWAFRTSITPSYCGLQGFFLTAERSAEQRLTGSPKIRRAMPKRLEPYTANLTNISRSLSVAKGNPRKADSLQHCQEQGSMELRSHTSRP